MNKNELDKLIDAAIIDGVLTEKEKSVLLRKAKQLGVDADEFEIVLNARLYERVNNQVQPLRFTERPESKSTPKYDSEVNQQNCKNFSATTPTTPFNFSEKIGSTINMAGDGIKNIIVKKQNKKEASNSNITDDSSGGVSRDIMSGIFKKITLKKCFWILIIAFIIFQIVELEAWAFVTAPLTIVLVLVFQKVFQLYRRDVLFWIIIIGICIVQGFTLEWWSVLTIPLSLVIAYYGKKFFNEIF